MAIEIETKTISLAMGESGDWSRTGYFTEQEAKELNEIGYTGKLNGQKTNLHEYLASKSTDSCSYELNLLKMNSMEFTEKYILTKAYTA